MKTLTILVSGAPAGDNLREVEIQPGTMAGDVLRSLSLNDYLLTPISSPQPFAEDECLYDLPDGTKLRCTPRAEVGNP